jgi:uncharacterized protein
MAFEFHRLAIRSRTLSWRATPVSAAEGPRKDPTMKTVAVAIVCKTPAPGLSKTRLSPPLSLEDCARLSAAFIQDAAGAVAELAAGGGVSPYVIYTPEGTEAALRGLLPAGFQLLPQSAGDLGERMHAAICELLGSGHTAVVLIGADSPTLPASILRQALEAVIEGDRAVIVPALDGGYLLIGLARPHAELFRGIAWSTAAVFEETLAAARAIGLPLAELPGWYDVDDEASLRLLEAELNGHAPSCAAVGVTGSDAAATRRLLSELRAGAASDFP